MITDEEFQDLLQQLVETSNCIKDGWFLDTVRNQTFAKKRHAVTLHRQSRTKENDSNLTAPETYYNKYDKMTSDKTDSTLLGLSDNGLEEEEFCEDDSTCMPPPVTTANSTQTIHYEYHIIYNASYAVPVMYLNVLNSCGQRLSLDEVWEMCPDTFQPYLKDNKWTILTQQEHPILGIPFLMLHPCHTADLMTQVTKDSNSETTHKRNYLVTWLSTIGPMVGLKLSDQYATSTNSQKEGR